LFKNIFIQLIYYIYSGNIPGILVEKDVLYIFFTMSYCENIYIKYLYKIYYTFPENIPGILVKKDVLYIFLQ
jgi:hypothetical protein